MSEYLKKQAVLEWLDDRRYKSPWIESFRDRLESGAFDADESEVQRLWAALMDTSLLIEDMAVSRIDDFCRLRDNARAMVAMIHSALSTTTEPPQSHIITEIKDLLEQWDFRAIAAELESGYDRGVLVELVELCEKLTGAKPPRAKTEQPKTDKTCVICGAREGKYLSTANRWFCEPCTDALPPVNANAAKVERVRELYEAHAHSLGHQIVIALTAQYLGYAIPGSEEILRRAGVGVVDAPEGDENE